MRISLNTAAILLTLLTMSACAPKPPECSDSKIASLIGSQIINPLNEPDEENPGLILKLKTDSTSLSNIETVSKDEKLAKTTCKANLSYKISPAADVFLKEFKNAKNEADVFKIYYSTTLGGYVLQEGLKTPQLRGFSGVAQYKEKFGSDLWSAYLLGYLKNNQIRIHFDPSDQDKNFDMIPQMLELSAGRQSILQFSKHVTAANGNELILDEPIKISVRHSEDKDSKGNLKVDAEIPDNFSDQIFHIEAAGFLYSKSDEFIKRIEKRLNELKANGVEVIRASEYDPK